MPDYSIVPFRCERHPVSDDCQRVVAIGEIDLATGPHLIRVLRDAQTHARHVVLDLGRTTFMDVGGARILRDADARTCAMAGTFVIAAATSPVTRLLALVGALAVTADPTFPPKRRSG